MNVYIRKLMAFDCLTHEQEKQIFSNKCLHKNHYARIIETHAKMVVKAAFQYQSFNLSTDDLIQEGMLGLLIAAQKFDPQYEVRFSTYAIWWIRAMMKSFILRNWSIVRSTSQQQKDRIRSQIQYYKNHLGVLESVTETGDDLYQYNLRLSQDMSLDTSIFENAEHQMQKHLVDPSASLEEDAMGHSLHNHQTKWIAQAIGVLNTLERQIICGRFLDAQKKKYADLSAQLNVSSARIKQIEGRALRKLQNYFKAHIGEIRVR